MSILRSVLVADDEASLRHVLTLVLQQQGYEVRAVSNGEEALAELETREYDAVISDVRMPRVDGLTVLRKALGRQPDLTFVVMSAYGQPDAALEAVAAGAFDYVSKPFKPEEVVLVLKKAEERRRLVSENRRLRRSGAERGPLDRIAGSSEAVKQLHRQILKVAPVSSTVLITGESGTGKELVARALHELSPR
ncbi:MAG TPA: response regulator, partial [Myxococcaceae bacterium]|nr:response regulator [Myxococcaceae bacterium]